jgi:hypothetical protein
LNTVSLSITDSKGTFLLIFGAQLFPGRIDFQLSIDVEIEVMVRHSEAAELERSHAKIFR